MKTHSVQHKETGVDVALFADLTTAAKVSQSMGPDFTTCTYIGFGGLPHVNVVVFELASGEERIESICCYEAQANDFARRLNEALGEQPDRYSVRKIMLNTEVPK